MLENIAQKIAVSTSEIIGYDVIIMDESSIIIGSSDVSRLGDLHEASIKIMKTGNPNPSSVNIDLLKGTKQGYALPLEFFNKQIGSFGITGRKEEVKGYCYLLKEYIETMLYQEMYVRSQIIREQAVESLLQEISTLDSIKQNESYILMRGQELGYDLQLSRVVIVIEFYKASIDKELFHSKINEHQSLQIKKLSFKQDIMKAIKNIFISTKDIIAPFQEDKFIIMPVLPVNHGESESIALIKEKCYQIKRLFKEKGLSVSIGIGSIAEDIHGLHQSYNAAWRSLELGKKRNSNTEIFYFYDLLLEDISLFATDSFSYKYIKQLIDTFKSQADSEELMQTISAWCESGFNKIKTAKKLFIHRNTLQYRLKKIHQLVDIDPTDFRKIIILYVGILMENMNKNEK